MLEVESEIVQLYYRYEAEEHDGVMRAMEAAAEKFIAGSTDPVEDLDIQPDATVADEQTPGGN